MDSPLMTYLHWAKTHQPAVYDLTLSGVAPVQTRDFPLRAVALTVTGAYGHPRLVELLAQRYGVAAEHVLPVTGTSTANVVALATCRPRGRTVLVESPCYEPLRRAAEFLGATIRLVERDEANGFRIDRCALQDALTDDCCALIISNHHNPSGHFTDDDEMRQLADLCQRHGLTLIVDEAYRDFAAIAGHAPLATAASFASHVVCTNSLTKVYGFGGLRAGWIVASADALAIARDVFNHLCVNVPAPTTDIAIQVLESIERYDARTRQIQNTNLALFSQWLWTRQDLQAHPNRGALHAFLRLPAGIDADAFCGRLVQRYDTLVVSGAFFRRRDHVRIGLGGPAPVLAEGLSRIGDALDDERP